MKATELSLENYVFDTINKRTVQIHGIEPTWNEVWVNYANGSGVYKLEINQIEPISLNEEWLIKFRFINNQSFYRLHVSEHFELINIGNKYCRAYYKSKSIKIDVQYVHQLMNLYFALTGSELTIKE